VTQAIEILHGDAAQGIAFAAADVAKVRDFFKRHPGEAYVPAFVAKTCGLPVSPTLGALCILLEDGEVRANVRGLEWTFSAKDRR
jgi:hypothetical protein